MDWQTAYKSKLVTAEEAVKKIQNGSQIVLSHAATEPKELVDALMDNISSYQNLKLYQMVCLGEGRYAKEDFMPHMRFVPAFASANSRGAINGKWADFIPTFFYQAPSLFDTTYLPDVAMISVSKPDEHGYCSLSLSTDFTRAATDRAKLVLAVVNDKLPRTFGDTLVHINEIDFIVEASREPLVLNPPAIGEVESKIGEYCASLVEDGATLQLGIGGIPDAVCNFLGSKKNLGIHSEMISDGVVDLIEKGVVNNKAKTLHKGKTISTFLMGTKKLYDYVNNNPSVELYPVSYTNDPCVIMQNSKMTTINSCIEIDLSGQICSEAVGPKHFSGVGGQVDFTRGANMAKDGKAIIVMPSTAAKGKVSRIAINLAEGAPVTTSKYDVNYVVTEYGIASLKGKSMPQRAKELITIAHPDFRPELIKEYETRFNRKWEN